MRQIKTDSRSSNAHIPLSQFQDPQWWGPMGFTLIELLVVITIIVVLLATLAPSLVQAVYQAELAVCATRMKGTANGATAYALDFKRFYTQRDVIEAGHTNDGIEAQPLVLAWDGFDDRERIEPYITMDTLVEAAAKPISLRRGEALNRVFSGYSLYFGVRFKGQTKGMTKVGDRFSFTDVITNVTHEYTLLAADFDLISDSNRFISGHPDSFDALPPFYYFNDGGFGTCSRYDNYLMAPTPRGLLDQNYAYTDGAVLRQNGIEINDPRTATVSHRVSPGASLYPSLRVQLPKR